MLLKHLYMVHEMTMLQQPIGDGATASASREDRGVLIGELQDRVKHTFRQIHKREYQDISVEAACNGYRHHVVMFDHCQPILKELVCNRFAPVLRPNPVLEETVWQETSDEGE